MATKKELRKIMPVKWKAGLDYDPNDKAECWMAKGRNETIELCIKAVKKAGFIHKDENT